MKKAIPKKTVGGRRPGAGRPATGKDPMVTLRMPPKLIESIESIAESESISKSDAIRQLIERGLQAWVEEQR